MKILWLLSSPLLFLLPGLLPARLVTGKPVTGWTLVWAFFFSLVLLPPAAFACAMLLGTTVRPELLFPLTIVMGAPGLYWPRRDQKPAA
ncbi:MAG: hypothetical protein GX444_10160 [Myxococcales bacterium]|nr:hypothetical protein [Myxococcales bacterium]